MGECSSDWSARGRSRYSIRHIEEDLLNTARTDRQVALAVWTNWARIWPSTPFTPDA
jgi:hypothetical protein